MRKNIVRNVIIFLGIFLLQACQPPPKKVKVIVDNGTVIIDFRDTIKDIEKFREYENYYLSGISVYNPDCYDSDNDCDPTMWGLGGCSAYVLDCFSNDETIQRVKLPETLRYGESIQGIPLRQEAKELKKGVKYKVIGTVSAGSNSWTSFNFVGYFYIPYDENQSPYNN